MKDWFLAAVDRDTEAFNSVLAAMRMPAGTDKDRTARESAMAAANLAAATVPLEVLEHTVDALDLALIVARDGNPNSVTDAGVGAACAVAAAEGASLNVRINLSALEGDLSAILERHDSALASARELGAQASTVVEEHLGSE